MKKTIVVTRTTVEKKLPDLDTAERMATFFGVTADAVRKWGDKPLPKGRVHFLRTIHPELFGGKP